MALYEILDRATVIGSTRRKNLIRKMIDEFDTCDLEKEKITTHKFCQ